MHHLSNAHTLAHEQKQARAFCPHNGFGKFPGQAEACKRPQIRQASLTAGKQARNREEAMHVCRPEDNAVNLRAQ